MTDCKAQVTLAEMKANILYIFTCQLSETSSYILTNQSGISSDRFAGIYVSDDNLARIRDVHILGTHVVISHL